MKCCSDIVDIKVLLLIGQKQKKAERAAMSVLEVKYILLGVL